VDDKRPAFDAIDWALVTAIVVLSIFLATELSWPVVEAWRNRPRPGTQVHQQYEKVTDGQNTAAWGYNYLLYLPCDYDTNRKWPLLVFLHGSGDRGEDLEALRRDGGLPRIVEAAVTCRCDPREQQTSESCNAHHLIRNRLIIVSPQCPKDVGWQPEHVIGLIEHIRQRFSVDRDRVYLTGYSMGGFGTWQTACHNPDRFAAIAPLAGGGDESQAERLVNMPIWAFHGMKDKSVPFESSEKIVEAVKKCGGHVEFTAYPDEGHGICDVTYQNPRLYEWLLAQRRSSSELAPAVAK
jgi:predicted peptidase